MWQSILDVLTSDIVYYAFESIVVLNILVIYFTYIDMQTNERILLIEFAYKKRQIDWRKLKQKMSILMIIMMGLTIPLMFGFMMLDDTRFVMVLIMIGYLIGIVSYSFFSVKSSIITS